MCGKFDSYTNEWGVEVGCPAYVMALMRLCSLARSLSSSGDDRETLLSAISRVGTLVRSARTALSRLPLGTGHRNWRDDLWQRPSDDQGSTTASIRLVWEAAAVGTRLGSYPEAADHRAWRAFHHQQACLDVVRDLVCLYGDDLNALADLRDHEGCCGPFRLSARR